MKNNKKESRERKNNNKTIKKIRNSTFESRIFLVTLNIQCYYLKNLFKEKHDVN